MSRVRVSTELKRLVRDRAAGLCEYCLTHDETWATGGEVDHIISEKHGGLTEPDNLAYSCRFCNRRKGADVAAIAPGSRSLVRLFNPRQDRWADHFRLGTDGVTYVGTTDIGVATIRLLRINDPDRLLERRELRDADWYPTPAARRRIEGE